MSNYMKHLETLICMASDGCSQEDYILLCDVYVKMNKLPRYANGVPFVPCSDPCWVWNAVIDTPSKGDPVCFGHQWRPPIKWISLLWDGNFYPTREACEEANR